MYVISKRDSYDIWKYTFTASFFIFLLKKCGWQITLLKCVCFEGHVLVCHGMHHVLISHRIYVMLWFKWGIVFQNQENQGNTPFFIYP